MGKLIKAKIDVTKIQESLLYVGKKGTYLDLNIWINDKPDNYGNEISIQQQTAIGDPILYIGEGKFWIKKEDEKIKANDKWQGSANKEAIVNKSKEQTEDQSDMPF